MTNAKQNWQAQIELKKHGFYKLKTYPRAKLKKYSKYTLAILRKNAPCRSQECFKSSLGFTELLHMIEQQSKGDGKGRAPCMADEPHWQLRLD